MPDFDFIEEGQTPTTTFDFQPDFQMPKPTALEQYKIEHMGGPPMGPFGPVIPPEEFIGTPNIFTIPLAAMAGAGKSKVVVGVWPSSMKSKSGISLHFFPTCR